VCPQSEPDLQQARGEAREERLQQLSDRAQRYLRETSAFWGAKLGAKPAEKPSA
jgi:hypothetical protein